MSLSSALSNALSGLNVSSREAELVANNVANAQTPGFTRRVADLAANQIGGQGDGARVAGVVLAEDPAAISGRRRSDAELGARNVDLDIATRLGTALGVPGNGTALADLAGDFENSLIAAANDPASDQRLLSLANGAKRYANAIAGLSTETQRLRVDADAEIASQVAQVNQSLQAIDRLNREIQMVSVGGGDASALIDTRKSLIDQVSSVLPLRTSQRANGEVALFTTNGATLLDGNPAEIGFDASRTITQDMTLASGALSGLTLNGRAVTVGEPQATGLMDGGSLGALFQQRDGVLPAFSEKLDALASDLLTRFQDQAVDPTLNAGDPGLFTDSGTAFDPVNQAGIAGRLVLNAAVEPASGELWRLRDGLNAAAQGPIGDATLLATLADTATALRAPDPALRISGSGGIAAFAAGLTGAISSAQQQAEIDASYTASVNQGLRDTELSASGVNTDTEMQRLLQIEQAYAANARVISAVDEMIRRLMEI